MLESNASGVAAEGAVGFIASLQAYYADAQLLILGVTFLFLISAIFVLNRAVDEIAKARTAREQAEAVFTRLTGLLNGIESGETPFNEAARSASRRVSMSGPARRSSAPTETSPSRASMRKKSKV